MSKKIYINHELFIEDFEQVSFPCIEDIPSSKSQTMIKTLYGKKYQTHYDLSGIPDINQLSYSIIDFIDQDARFKKYKNFESAIYLKQTTIISKDFDRIKLTFVIDPEKEKIYVNITLC